MAQTDGIHLESALTEVRGVGTERAGQLARLHCVTVADLLLLAPRRHEDRRATKPIARIELGAAVTLRGKITALGVSWFQHRRQSVFELVVDDGTARLHCRWWNQPYLEKQFRLGEDLLIYGKVVSLRPRTIDQPEIERAEGDGEDTIHLRRIVPVYPLTEGLPQRWLRGLIHRLLAEPSIDWPELWPGLDLKPWPDRGTAVRWLHFPDQPDQPEIARQRLALDEFIAFQMELRARRARLETRAAAPPCSGDNRLIKPWLAALGFRLTRAQTLVLREIRGDLARGIPMRRLLQGDVGAGKTVVAGAAALMALETGWRVVLMAPTEILAEQHHRTFGRWFEPLGIPIMLQTGSHKELPRTGLAGNGQASGALGEVGIAGRRHPGLVIGTHALIEQGFELADIGLVIIDEQHKFGVVQRETLLRKGRHPHLLVMTATPIPRTLGLTLYGDLDCSVLGEKPAGRGAIKTFVRTVDRLPRVWDFVRQTLAEGHQAYVVYPLVAESEKSALKAATQEWERLALAMSPHPVGLLHGRLSSAEKDETMNRFRRGELQMLVATTVIEVGVDVPNATVLVVENADRFGLAQLHQLRGRIGRGNHDACCILVAQAKSGAALERLHTLETTDDGFRIAEADLRIRGAGEFLGQQQSGRLQFHFGDLTRDLALLERARQCAAALSAKPDRAPTSSA